MLDRIRVVFAGRSRKAKSCRRVSVEICAFLGANAWIATENGLVYRTNDGGNTWQDQFVNRRLSFTDIFFINSKTGWLQTPLSDGYMGVLYRTDDGGETWQLQPKLSGDSSLFSVSFLDANMAWGVGQDESAKPILWVTSDGGNSWKSSTINLKDWIFWDTHFLDADHAWLIGADKLYYTENGGKSWRVAKDLRKL